MITAVLLCYYRERVPHIPRIIEALRTGTTPPDRIVVVNNNPNIDIKKVVPMGIDYIQASDNLGHRARFIVGMLYPSDYYFFIDDDMCPGKTTIANYMRYANPQCCLTHLGRQLSPEGNYNRGGFMLRGSEVTAPTPSGLVIGVGSIFCSFAALANMVQLEVSIRTKTEYHNGREADIILGMANNSYVVPTDKDSQLIELGQKGVGMYKQEGHNVMRNLITRIIYDLKGTL